MAVYTNDLRLKEIATGDESGTWGTSTNTNLSLVAEAFSFGTEAITTNADTHTTTIADGSTDPGRSLFLKYTGTLDSACTITIGPNTVSKLWLIQNSTSGSQNIIIKQGSGATVTVPNGQTKAIYSDGAGSGGAMVDAFAHLNVVDLTVEDDLTITDDLSVGGTLGVTGVLTANAGVVVDNITIDGTEIDLSSGDLTIDVAGDIILDADGADIRLSDGGTQFGKFTRDSGDFVISSSENDKDMKFAGADGGADITALTLDMSDAGAATFNSSVTVGGAINMPTSINHVGDTTTFFGFPENTHINFTTNNVERLRLAPTYTVFNDSGADTNFIVETSGNTAMLFVDGGSNHVNIGSTTDYGGVTNIVGTDNGNTLVLVSTDTDADFGPALSLYRESTSSAADNDGLAQVNFQGLNDANQATTYAQQFAMIEDATDGTEDGMFILKTIVNGSTRSRMAMTSASGTVFNEDGQDLDFRVESDTQANAFSVLGSTGSVGFGVADGDVTNDGTAARTYVGIIGTANRGRLNIGTTASNGADAGTLAFTNGTNSLAEFVVDTHSGVQNAGDLTIDVTGDIILDADGEDIRFKDGGTQTFVFTMGTGSTISTPRGNLTLDVAGDIILDADGAEIVFKDAGTQIGRIRNVSSGEFTFQSDVSDKDIVFNGNDGGSTVTALQLDMSDGGTAIFGSWQKMADNNRIVFGAGSDLSIYSDGTDGQVLVSGNLNVDASGVIKLDADDAGEIRLLDGGTQYLYFKKDGTAAQIQNVIADGDIKFVGTDDSSLITALTLDMSEAGTATFNSTCNATGYIFSNDSDTGVIRGDANQINLRTGGADNFILTSTQLTIPKGTASAPGLAFTGDDNTGINAVNADNLGFTVGGSQKAFLSATQFNVTGNGVFSGSISKGSGSFKIDHPLPAKTDTHHLVHSFVEAPQADNIYRGSVDLVGGSATVNIDTAAGMTDGTFVLLNTNVQCFTSNESGWTAIKGSVSGNTLTITAQDNSCTDTISWMVVGERHDQHMKDTEWTDSDGKVIVEPEKT